MRAAEGGEEVVERVFVGDVYRGKMQAPLVLVAVKEVVFADGRIEEIARRNAGRIGVVVARAGLGNLHQA